VALRAVADMVPWDVQVEDTTSPELVRSNIAVDYVNPPDCILSVSVDTIQQGCFPLLVARNQHAISSYTQLEDILNIIDEDGTQAGDGLIQLRIRHNSRSVLDVNATYPIGTEFSIDLEVSDWSGNTWQLSQSWYVVDTLGPLIALKGDATLNILWNDTYTDAGAIAYDSRDGYLANVTAFDDVNTSEAGEYQVQYLVFDRSGNNATATRRVIVSQNQGASRSSGFTMSTIAGVGGGLVFLILLVLLVVLLRRRRNNKVEFDDTSEIKADRAHQTHTMTTLASLANSRPGSIASLAALENYNLAELIPAGDTSHSRHNTMTSLPAPENYSVAELSPVGDASHSRHNSMRSLPPLPNDLSPELGPAGTASRRSSSGVSSEFMYDVVENPNRTRLLSLQASLNSLSNNSTLPSSGPSAYDVLDSHHRLPVADSKYSQLNRNAATQSPTTIIDGDSFYDSIDLDSTGPIEELYDTVVPADEHRSSWDAPTAYQILSLTSFTHDVDRVEAELLLKTAKAGSYLARQAGSRAGTMVLSLKRANGRISHHTIDQVGGTYRFNSKPINVSTKLTSLEAAMLYIVGHDQDFLQEPDEFRSPVPVLDISEL
jgi:hypothetical protein